MTAHSLCFGHPSFELAFATVARIQAFADVGAFIMSTIALLGCSQLEYC